MSEEVSVPAVEPAPEQQPTADVAPEVSTPEAPSEQPTKVFSQEEVDALIGKRLAREQRKWEREQALRAPPAQAPAAPVVPEQFESQDAYLAAAAEQRATQLLQEREAQRQQMETIEAYRDREEAAREKYDDFAQVAHNPNLPITQAMAQAIHASDVGPEIAYYLGTNPKEAARIANLQSPILQAKELGKIEAKLAENPPVKKTSTAPAPIAPVTARASGAPSIDTTDPRSIKSMTTSEWIAAERQRQIRKYEAQR